MHLYTIIRNYNKLKFLLLWNWSRIGGIVLTGYVVPGCMEDGTWMLWENSSVAAVAVVVAWLFHIFCQCCIAANAAYLSPMLDIFCQ